MELGHLLAVARRQARDADILEAGVPSGDAGRLQLELKPRKEAHNLLLLSFFVKMGGPRRIERILGIFP